MSSASLAEKADSKYPPQIKYIVGNEAAERFSYYGMRAILVVFMVQYLGIVQHEAKGIYHLFISANYFLPLVGGYLSDRFLGKYRTIIYLSVVYCMGHLVLALFESKTGMYCGLGLVALGAGGIKPCVSAHVGDQFTKKNSHLLKSIYEIFYFSINFGSFFSTLLIPWLLPRYGSGVAFGIPGILMAVATLVFWMGRHQYVHIPPAGKAKSSQFFNIFFYGLFNLGKKNKGESFLEVAKAKYPVEKVEGAKAAVDVFKVLISVSAFWALFEQHGSSWVLQAKAMDLTFLGTKWEASQIPALNPIMVMILIPTFSYGIYPLMERLGVKMTPLRRIGGGMLLTGLSFVFAGAVQAALEGGATVSVGWQFPQYIILTMAEVMVSITGLEFAYTQGPRAMKSTIMSLWLLTVTAGNLFTAAIEFLNKFSGSAQFYFFAVVMFVISLIFVVMASRYQYRNYVEDDAATA